MEASIEKQHSINFNKSSNVTQKQMNYVNLLVKNLTRKGLYEEYITNLCNNLDNAFVSKEQMQALIKELVEKREEARKQGYLLSEADELEAKKTGYKFDLINGNLKHEFKTLSNIIINVKEHLINGYYTERSFLLGIPLSLSDLSAEIINERKIDCSKKYTLQCVFSWCNQTKEGQAKKGVVYSFKNKTFTDVKAGCEVSINNDDFVMVGVNLKFKQWKQIIDDEGNVIIINDTSTRKGKFFDYNGAFWNTFNDVTNESMEEINNREILASRALKNRELHKDDFNEFVKIHVMSKEELEKHRNEFQKKATNNSKPTRTDPPPKNNHWGGYQRRTHDYVSQIEWTDEQIHRDLCEGREVTIDNYKEFLGRFK